MVGLAFAHLNLRRNPFGELTTQERVEVAVVDNYPRLEHDTVQIIAGQGHGKSTVLRVMAARVEGAVYARVREGTIEVDRRCEPGRAYLLDEADQIPPRMLASLIAGADGVVLATHMDLSSHLTGRVRTWTLPALDATRLGEMASRRLKRFRRCPGPIPVPTAELLAALMATHGSNIRAIEDALYFRYQRMEGPVDGIVWSED